MASSCIEGVGSSQAYMELRIGPLPRTGDSNMPSSGRSCIAHIKIKIGAPFFLGNRNKKTVWLCFF